MDFAGRTHTNRKTRSQDDLRGQSTYFNIDRREMKQEID